MDRLTGLLKERHIGEWCKRAAWIIAAIGLIEIVLAAYSLILQMQQFNGTGIMIPLWSFVITNLELPLSMIAQATFFFFALYAAGTFINNFIGAAQGEEEEDELLVENGEDDIMPGQFSPE
jgi:hypothetical protein